MPITTKKESKKLQGLLLFCSISGMLIPPSCPDRYYLSTKQIVKQLYRNNNSFQRKLLFNIKVQIICNFKILAIAWNINNFVIFINDDWPFLSYR